LLRIEPAVGLSELDVVFLGELAESYITGHRRLLGLRYSIAVEPLEIGRKSVGAP
jgi:hypothetical protein